MKLQAQNFISFKFPLIFFYFLKKANIGFNQFSQTNYLTNKTQPLVKPSHDTQKIPQIGCTHLSYIIVTCKGALSSYVVHIVFRFEWCRGRGDE
jgi:hypothetical protein